MSVGFRPFRTGRLRLPALPAGGLLLGGLEAEVLPALKGEETPHEPRGPLPLAGTGGRIAALLALALGGPLGLAAAFWGGRRALREARRRAARERPFRRARRALRRLAAAPGLEERVFFTRLSTVVRGYLEQRFALPASSLTSRELEAALAAAGQPASGQAAGAGRLLRKADRYRFSGERPPSAAAAGALWEAEALLAALEKAPGAGSAGGPAPGGGPPGGGP